MCENIVRGLDEFAENIEELIIYLSIVPKEMTIYRFNSEHYVKTSELCGVNLIAYQFSGRILRDYNIEVSGACYR